MVVQRHQIRREPEERLWKNIGLYTGKAKAVVVTISFP